jgi:hypothetical protein
LYVGYPKVGGIFQGYQLLQRTLVVGIFLIISAEKFLIPCVVFWAVSGIFISQHIPDTK